MSAVMEDCRYDAEKHEYWRGDRKLPSITQIIAEVWARRDGAPEDAIEKARLRGEFVDMQFMFWLAGNDLTIQAGIPQEWVDALGQAIDYWNTYRAGSKVQCQVRLFGQDEAGTCDLIIEGTEIVELKSTWEISKTVPAQLGGYGWLHDTEPMTFGVLHCHKRLKKAKFMPVDSEIALHDWRTVRDFYRLTRA